MTPTDLAQTLGVQLVYTHFAVTKALDGVSQEQSLAAPPGGGNCMNWVLGHLAASRNAMLAMAGLLFHESYHAGQLGVLRRTLGLDSIIK